MADGDTAQELERKAAQDPVHPALPHVTPAMNEAMAMLVRRGFVEVSRAKLDLPFDPEAHPGPLQDRFAEALRHYAFRLFLRGAIQHPEGYSPEEATRFLSVEHARTMAGRLVELGLAEAMTDGRYRLLHPPNSFGGTLEWYVGWELAHRLLFDVAVGVKFHAPGVGGDLDVVAAAEGRLVYVELKSSPPKHLAVPEVSAFYDRVRALRPDVTLFAVDTALRLGDRVIPLLDEVRRKGSRAAPTPARRVERELWSITPHVYALNARPDLFCNVARAIAEGLLALAPEPP